MRKSLVMAVMAMLFWCSPVALAEETVNGQTVETLEWDTLMPEGFNLDEVFAKTEQFGSLDDFDPRAQELLDEMMVSLKSSPVVENLDGKMVRLPGFVVPLEGDGQRVDAFFLVPYFGACIHVPPPPANQMVHVTYEPGVKVENLYDAIWVTGRLSVTTTDHELGTAGYAMDAFVIEPYTE